jgi:hypothetical protein
MILVMGFTMALRRFMAIRMEAMTTRIIDAPEYHIGSADY